MYLSIIRVFTPYLNKYMLKFSLMGWGKRPSCWAFFGCFLPEADAVSLLWFAGIPLIVVVVVIAVDKDNYGPVGFDKYTNATGNDL